MSGPDDRPDDPDEVTLWAGRLRAWPANPPADADEADVDDSAVRSGDDEPDDATAIAHPATPVDEPDDATVIARRAAPADEPDDATVVAHRAVPAAELDDDTVRRAPADEPTRRRGEVATPPIDDDTEPGSRTRRPSALVEPDDSTRPRTAPGDTDDTRAGSRRARRAASGEASSGGEEPATVALGPAVPGALREARVPSALQRESYDPRVDAPIRVERSVRPTLSAPRRDAALVRPRATRGSAWRALLIGAAVVLLLAAAAGAAVLLPG
ncbi:hypothetical protein SAMN04487848_0935 [Microbacterium sp. ru370.1]|uniref:hypothetical protein n=1 Tax=unclassified Microbacterium TaxID=2609290 RepID=UPI000884D094|nr:MULTISPECIES: hypothetical protein [unclassified Microbacterium]SDO44644.1 hypothetical protein SAMN04487848_0935 [Microbacterium sp. ru370.1]SIT81047.1 hypothetical protein SAMN05880579_0931 [Microbacterium sp. RU1D]